MSAQNSTSKFVISLLFVSICWSGCAYKKDDTQTKQDRLNQAAEKIQKSNYDEAESELQDYLREHPDHARAKVLLASLYAHRAGLRIRDYFKLERVINSKPVMTEPYIQNSVIETLNQNPDEKIKKVAGYLKQLNEVIIQAQHWNQKINELPTWTDAQALDLDKAIQVLNELDENRVESEPDPERRVTEGMILYRGVLRIYQFKYFWTTDHFLPIYAKSVCTTAVKTLEGRVSALALFIESALSDFAVGLPSSRKSTLQTLQDFRSSAGQVRAWFQNARRSKDTFEKYLKDNSGAAELKCDF